jgi:hypothetical protein
MSSNQPVPHTRDYVPDEYQADLAALNRPEDEALWKIDKARKITSEMARYEALLQQNQDQTLSATDRADLTALRMESNRFMLRKARPQSSFTGVVSQSFIVNNYDNLSKEPYFLNFGELQ